MANYLGNQQDVWNNSALGHIGKIMWDFLSSLITSPFGRRGGFPFLYAVLAGIACDVITEKLDYIEWAPYAGVLGFFLYGGLAVLYTRTHHQRFRRRRFR
jgi:hypothetical protein